ncbi:MAG TPA: hypothetical protein VFI47_18345 [Acidimicrobiales bacterium]|nr:hypothetical protein [Acidimicrobiales bacterium]
MNGLDERAELLRQIRDTVRVIMWLLLAPILISLVFFLLNAVHTFS